MAERQRIACLYQGEGLFAGGNGAFKLGVLGEREHGLELRGWAVSGGDEVAPGEQRRGTEIGGGLGLVLGVDKVVAGEVAVGGECVEVVQGEVLIEAGQAEEALEGGLLHLEHIAEAHVVADEGEDLCGVVVGEAQACEDGFGDAYAGLDVAVEADSAAGGRRVGGLVGGGLADVVQQRGPG